MTAEFREFLYPHRAIEQKFKEDGLCSAVSRMWQWNSQQQYDEYKARYNETQRCIEELEARREALTAKRGKLLGYLDMLRKQGPIRTFNETLWCGAVEQVRILKDGTMRFIFKDGAVVEG